MIHRTHDFLIENVEIKSSGRGIVIGSGSGAVSGKIKDSTIEATDIGIETDLYGEILELENVKLIKEARLGLSEEETTFYWNKLQSYISKIKDEKLQKQVIEQYYKIKQH